MHCLKNKTALLHKKNKNFFNQLFNNSQNFLDNHTNSLLIKMEPIEQPK